MSDSSSPKAALEFKSATLTVPALLLASNDLEEIEQHLVIKMAQAPDLFRQSPVVIDVHRVNGQELALEVEPLVTLLRKLNMVPISLRGGNEAQNRCAEALGLALGSMPSPRANSVSDPTNAPKEKAAPTTSRAVAAQADTPNLNKTITLPVRSGQRVYSRGDLIIMATVSAGAEVMAEGNIHIYGSLRGKALAGVLGDASARIFCMDLQAELISIAGIYQLSEDIAETPRNKPTTISLDNQMLMIKEI